MTNNQSPMMLSIGKSGEISVMFDGLTQEVGKMSWLSSQGLIAFEISTPAGESVSRTFREPEEVDAFRNWLIRVWEEEMKNRSDEEKRMEKMLDLYLSLTNV